MFVTKPLEQNTLVINTILERKFYSQCFICFYSKSYLFIWYLIMHLPVPLNSHRCISTISVIHMRRSSSTHAFGPIQTVLYVRYSKDTSAYTCSLCMHTAKTSQFNSQVGHPSHSTTSSLYILLILSLTS